MAKIQIKSEKLTPFGGRLDARRTLKSLVADLRINIRFHICKRLEIML